MDVPPAAAVRLQLLAQEHASSDISELVRRLPEFVDEMNLARRNYAVVYNLLAGLLQERGSITPGVPDVLPRTTLYVEAARVLVERTDMGLAPVTGEADPHIRARSVAILDSQKNVVEPQRFLALVDEVAAHGDSAD